MLMCVIAMSLHAPLPADPHGHGVHEGIPHAPSGSGLVIQPENSAAGEGGWQQAEAPILTDHVQLTERSMFTRAGEAYFSPNADWIIFQATPVPPRGEEPSPHYEMYVAKLTRDVSGAISGIETPIQVSKPGSANTCGWFHPTEPRILFGSTVTPPQQDDKPGYQRDGSNYQWAFPRETEIVSMELPWLEDGSQPQTTLDEASGTLILDEPVTTPLFSRDGYDAEGSWSADGRWVLYTHVDPASDDADLWVWDSESDEHTLVVTAEGYDGGPFFSPAGDRIIYRSDRRGDKMLQVFVSDFNVDEDTGGGGTPSVTDETHLTDDEDVNWAPFFHPSGRVVIWTTSREGHFNYEVYGIDARSGIPLDERASVRITQAGGFDGLSVFSPDGEHMMWTAQRGPIGGTDERPSSQLWIANFNLDAYLEAQTEVENQLLGGGAG